MNPFQAINGPRVIIIVIGAVWFLTFVQAQERDTCVTASVPEAYVLPDGSVHDAGRLSLCLSEAMSPVTGLHRVAVEGHTLGLARSQRSQVERRDLPDPVVLFRRRGGRLELVGYIVRIERKTWSYVLADPAPDPVPGELVAVLGRRT